MSLLKSVGDFLFGKSPDIFDKDGHVRHDLGKKKWEEWDSRYKNNPEYNWKNHAGTQAKKNKTH